MRKVSKETRDKNKERERQRRSTLQGRAYQLLVNYQRNDRKKGWFCDLTIEFLVERIITTPCTYCGDTARVGCDRLDHNRGHTRDNVIGVCIDCNRARSNTFSVSEMLVIGAAIRAVKEARKKYENPKPKHRPGGARNNRPEVPDRSEDPRRSGKGRGSRKRESRRPRQTPGGARKGSPKR